MDVQNSLSMAFLAISDQCEFFLKIFLQNGRRRSFWMSEIHFLSHVWPFQIDTQLFFKIFTKWLPSTILEVRNSLLMAFLAISDRYATLIFLKYFDKMAAVGHFGYPKFTFHHICGHFRLILNFIFFLNILQNGRRHLFFDVRNSLLIAFLAISDRYATFIFGNF